MEPRKCGECRIRGFPYIVGFRWPILANLVAPQDFIRMGQ